MSDKNSAINLLRAQYKQCQEWLEGTMQGVTPEVASYAPEGNISPISGQIAHSLTGLDFFLLNVAAGKAPLLTTTFAGKAGISEPPPQGGDWVEWGRKVQVDLPAVHEYGKALFAAVDEYLASLTDADLEREVEFPFGKYPLSWVFNIMLLNTHSHTGEISVLKGLQGLKGYAM